MPNSLLCLERSREATHANKMQCNIPELHPDPNTIIYSQSQSSMQEGIPVQISRMRKQTRMSPHHISSYRLSIASDWQSQTLP